MKDLFRCDTPDEIGRKTEPIRGNSMPDTAAHMVADIKACLIKQRIGLARKIGIDHIVEMVEAKAAEIEAAAQAAE